MALGVAVDLGPGHTVLDGDQLPSAKGGRAPPPFLAHLYCAQTTGCIKMPLGTEACLSPNDIVLYGDPAPLQKRHSPQFSAHVYCGQTDECVRIPLGTEISLSIGDIVLDGDPASHPLKGHKPPIFGQCPLWPSGYNVGLRCHLV